MQRSCTRHVTTIQPSCNPPDPHAPQVVAAPGYMDFFKVLNSYNTGPYVLRIGGTSTDNQDFVPGRSVWDALRRVHQEAGASGCSAVGEADAFVFEWCTGHCVCWGHDGLGAQGRGSAHWRHEGATSICWASSLRLRHIHQQAGAQGFACVERLRGWRSSCCIRARPCPPTAALAGSNAHSICPPPPPWRAPAAQAPRSFWV